MLSRQDISRILFLDIETVRGYQTFQELPATLKDAWNHKSEKIKTEEEQNHEQKYIDRAGIFAEFGKVICVSFGFINWQDDVPHFRVKSFYADDEKSLLLDFKKLLEEKFKGWLLCAHNGKEFDFPYLGRRFLINQIPLPSVLQVQGKKPWEIPFLDTMELWRFGDYKNYTKLELLCAVFGIPTPKDDIDGSQVGKVYWEEQGLERITRYCEKDVIATAQVMLKYAVLPAIEEAYIHSATFDD